MKNKLDALKKVVVKLSEAYAGISTETDIARFSVSREEGKPEAINLVEILVMPQERDNPEHWGIEWEMVELLAHGYWVTPSNTHYLHTLESTDILNWMVEDGGNLSLFKVDRPHAVATAQIRTSTHSFRIDHEFEDGEKEIVTVSVKIN